MRYFLALLLIVTSAVWAFPVNAAHNGYTVGAIRWDPWYEPNGNSPERFQVEAALSPPKWQFRAPACATVVNSYTLDSGSCNSQAVMDVEIAAAAAAHIDYWAFCWYAQGTSLQNAWSLYQSSSLKNNINWSMITSYSRLVSDLATYQSTFITYFGQSNYQKVVISGISRPLVYVLADGNATISQAAAAIATLRSALQTAGYGNPYVVALVGVTTASVTSLGADATGNYSQSATVGAATPYATMVSQQEAYWATLAAAATSASVGTVPTAVTGADRRPRVERPESFQIPAANGGQRPYVGDSLYVVAGAASAIAAHVSDMLTWLSNNTAAAPAKTGLIYSWSEHDEGGSTLNPSLGGGSTILNAVAGVL